MQDEGIEYSQVCKITRILHFESFQVLKLQFEEKLSP